MSKQNTKMTPRQIWTRAVISILIVIIFLWLMFHVNLDQYPEASLWIKAIHVVAIISWMAGMLYLPRLFVYHCQATIGTSQSEIFKVMERKLLRLIINPAMVVAWVTGLWMAWELYQFQGGWLHAKLAIVIILSGFHGFLSASTRHFAEDRNRFSEKAWRMFNEVPTVLMILAVVVVIVKPF